MYHTANNIKTAKFLAEHHTPANMATYNLTFLSTYHPGKKCIFGDLKAVYCKRVRIG